MSGHTREMHMTAPFFGREPSPKAYVYSSAHATWSAHELHLLHKGLTQYTADEHDNVTRYIKIAATIPGKCIRDVAVKVRSMQVSQEKMAEPPSKRPKMEHADVHAVVSCEDQIKHSLQTNVSVINTMRANLATGDLDDNVQLMAQFRDSCHSIFKKLHTVCSAVPPLQIKIDTSLIPLHMRSPSNQDDV
ncbi:hypothetical protein SPRG_07248 [Saprolegnia parasitica CBS 223.65]|uniref:Myb-like domain-containing protein n=1 Tax=Saprolegnia parasitica (strain CBS 223.65) TaxID=695850 RepID=A0A067CN45_SAPPC|nr:hypothetical protein SPRG_07248 [Saprolegnia parasitica CBS 223.65]KDO27971.1 hypothetical protein SPRG_07248 [Saprolegnia parasitica CBS 223.65]|eukprot:XP_012201420.1 hypothetical protein SPRG_07248 [Saprolegnia parasitica CBS 223.65]